MKPNHSPWIHQLQRTRPAIPLQTDLHTDVLIVGGGIAGVMTAYFTLRETNKRVVLLEAGKIAHGATGYNAGQITSYFERPLTELVEEFGLALAIDGQRSVESAWDLLADIQKTVGLHDLVYRFTGYAGCASLDQLLIHLKNNVLRIKGGLRAETFLVSQESGWHEQIPNEYQTLYQLVPKQQILAALETSNHDYEACFSFQKGCTNSAVLTEEVIHFLLTHFQGRFSFYEQSPVTTVRLEKETVMLHVLGNHVVAQRVVLCTNGFANIRLANHAGPDIDPKFHQLVHGRIGYMSGYLEDSRRKPTAISYFPKATADSQDPTGESYFYLTRRPHGRKGMPAQTLISTGGPERVLPNHAVYEQDTAVPEGPPQEIDTFLQQNYAHYPKGGAEHIYHWHGLMGYTPNGVRCIGVEPCNPVLLYNLGCNGVGILPSIYGGKRIADILAEKPINPSLFDPRDQSCVLPKRSKKN